MSEPPNDDLQPRLLGRDRELVTLRAAMERGARVVTLIGPGGVGKTTLARAFCAEQRRATPFCDLSRARTRMDVVTIIARTLGIDVPGGTTTDAIEDAVSARLSLRDRPVNRIVLDNAEQVAQEVGRVVQRWSATVPHVKFLVTSREPLELPDERSIVVPPLSCASRSGALSDAASLLRTRVEESSLTPEPWADIEDARWNELAASLEGFPLALELTAAGIADLGVGAVAARLPSLLESVEATQKGVADRQRSLRASLDWSWSLLSPDESRALTYLSVFPGDFSMTLAARALGDDDARAVPRLRVLVRKSMIRATDAKRSQLALYASVRQFAREKLGDEAYVEVVQRVGAYLAASCRDVGPVKVAGRAAESVQERFGVANLLHWAELGLRIESLYATALVLGRALASGPAIGESAAAAHLVVERLCEHPRFAEVDEATRSEMMLVRAKLGALVGAPERTRELCDAAEAMLPETAKLERAELSRWRGVSLARAGRLDESIEEYLHAAQVFEEAGLQREHIAVTLAVVHAEESAGRPEKAAAILDSLPLHTLDPVSRSRAAQASAAIAVARRDYAGASRWAAMATAAAQEAGNPLFIAMSTTFRAATAILGGDLDDAASLLDAASQAARVASWPQLDPYIAINRAAVSLARGKTAEAERAIDDADAGLRAHFAEWSPRLDVTLWQLLVAATLGDARRVRQIYEGALRTTHVLPAWATELVVASDALVVLAEHRAGGRAPDETAKDSRLDAFLERLTSTTDEQTHLVAAAIRRMLHAPPRTVLSRERDRWRLTPGPTIDLSRHKLLSRLLERLARAAIEGNDRTVSNEDLVRAGWPGERASEDSLNVRLRVALTRLRKLGLGELLVTQPGGQRLHESVEPHLPAAETATASKPRSTRRAT